MLNMQVAYWTLVETKRHNMAVEFETQRHNVETEIYNYHVLAEEKRHNIAFETETQRHNIAMENYYNNALRETVRHNLVSERIDLINAQTQRINAATNRYNAETNRLNVRLTYDLGLRKNLVDRANATTNRINANLRSQELANQVKLTEIKQYETNQKVAQDWSRISQSSQSIRNDTMNTTLNLSKFEWQQKYDRIDLGIKAVNSFSNIMKSSKNQGDRNREALKSATQVVTMFK